jgi:hypothetical protein
LKVRQSALLGFLCGAVAAAAFADEPTASPTPAAETRPTGLPQGLEWTFNIDATVGTFGFHNSLYTDPKPEQPSGDLPEADSETRLWGANYEYAIGEDTTIGATYLSVAADAAAAPEREGLEVYNLRVYAAPLPRLPGLTFEAEYAREDNGEALDSYAWTALAAYQLDSPWSPRLSYRYAFFEGDDSSTTFAAIARPPSN